MSIIDIADILAERDSVADEIAALDERAAIDAFLAEVVA